MKTVLYLKPAFTNETKIAGVMEIAAPAGWHVQVSEIAPRGRNVKALISFWQPIGLIVDCGRLRDEIDSEVFGRLPVVFLDRNPATLPSGAVCVSHDSIATANLAAKELLTTGYDHFAYVHAPGCPFWSRSREEGFRSALAINGKTPDILATERPTGGLGFQRSLRKFLSTLSRPCAVFAANDQTALEVAVAANQTHLSVPSDIAVIGVDNQESVCERSRPPLTSIEPDFRGGAVSAAMMLQSMVNGTRIPVTERKRTFGPLRVVTRASTRVLVNHDKDVARALDLIARDSCRGLTAAEVIRCFSCSRGEAERRFRKETGRSVLEAIHAERLARVQEMLRIPGYQLKAINDFCGFKTPGALRKFFIQNTGMTMSEWRRTGQSAPTRLSTPKKRET